MYLNLSIKHTILQIIAITFNNLALLIWAIAIYLENRSYVISYQYVLFSWYFEDFTLWIKSLCIYLSFIFAKDGYMIICGGIHNKLEKKYENSVKEEIYESKLEDLSSQSYNVTISK